MTDTAPPTAAGKVLWRFSMSLDGFVAGPGHSMDWMAGTGGTRSPTWNVYGGLWQGSVFVLTHHREDAEPAAGVTFLSCDVAEAARTALAAAGGKNLEVLSAPIGSQPVRLGLVDEIDLRIAPVLLGDGNRLFEDPGGRPVPLRRTDVDDPGAEVDVRYRLRTDADG